MKTGNLFSAIPGDLPGERLETLVEGDNGRVRIERIVSRGQASPPGFWFDQETVEWVVLLRGAAVLRFEGEADPRPLWPGDWVEIPAHCRHRVEETAAGEDTVWLAVHWE